MIIFDNRNSFNRFSFGLHGLFVALNLYSCGQDVITHQPWYQLLFDLAFLVWWGRACYKDWKKIRDSDDDDDKGTPIPIWRSALGMA
jgi:hypothetical protein